MYLWALKTGHQSLNCTKGLPDKYMESTAPTPPPAASATDLSSRTELCYTGTEMSDKASLKMVTCGVCETKVFIPGDLAPLLRKKKIGDSVKIEVQRGKETVKLDLKLGKREE